jgi:hypothetical protein
LDKPKKLKIDAFQLMKKNAPIMKRKPLFDFKKQGK